MNNLHSAALAYAAIGWPVFPLAPLEKVPLHRNPHRPGSEDRAACPGLHGGCGRDGHGVKDATTDPGVIHRWWSANPRAGIGMACGVTGGRHAPDVLDIDVKKGAPGALSRERLRRVGLLAGCWAQVRTPSGGEHLYFDGTTQGNGMIKAAGVDFRSAGGYVVMPPTEVWLTPPGGFDGTRAGTEVGAYRWLASPNLAKEGVCDWAAVKRLLQPPHLWPPRPPGDVPQAAGVGALVIWLEGQAEGGRNAALHWAVCKALEADHHADVEALAAAGRRIGLTAAEVAKTVQSARRRAIVSASAGAM